MNIIKIARELERLTGHRISLSFIIRLIFEREYDGFSNAKGNGVPEAYAEAVGRNYWQWAQDLYGTHTGTTLLNWLGDHNYSATSLYNDIFNNLPTGKGGMTLERIIGKNRDSMINAGVASEISTGLLNTPPEWKIFDGDAPYAYAFCNKEICMIPSLKMQQEFWDLPDTPMDINGNYIFSIDLTNMYFNFDDSYIITYNQFSYWYKQ